MASSPYFTTGIQNYLHMQLGINPILVPGYTDSINAAVSFEHIKLNFKGLGVHTPELHVIFIFISEIQVNAARKLGCCLPNKADNTALRHYSLVNFKKFGMITVLLVRGNMSMKASSLYPQLVYY